MEERNRVRSATDCSSNKPLEPSDTDIDAYAEKVCMDLKSGKLVACPFCPMKKQDFCYNELLNHAIRVGAKHEALANLLRTDHADAAGSLPARQAKSQITPRKRSADDPVGGFLLDSSELKTVSGLQVELSRKTTTLITSFTNQIAAKSKQLLELDNEINLTLQSTIEDTDSLHQYNEEMQNVHSLVIKRNQLDEKKSGTRRRYKQSEVIAQVMERRKLEDERKRNDEQRKLNEVVRSMVEKHKKEKEAALNKILVLENLLDEKQMLELDLQQLEGNLGVMKHVEMLCQTEKMMNMDEVQEKLAAIKHLDELNQTQERMAYDKLQCARKGLIKNDGQSCSFPTEGECSNHTSAVIQDTTSRVPRGVPVTRVPYLSRIKELECRKDWMMVVEVPESLSLEDTTADPFVVQLGNDGGGTLRQLLKCFEQLWANSLCLKGNITKHNIYFVKESGIFEVHVTPDQVFQIDDAGFKLDTLAIVELLSVFKFAHKRYKSKQYPMYLLELVIELKSAGLDPEYFRDAKKRSLIHNSAVTMTPEQRAQVYTAIIRYWHAISEDNLQSFLDAMDPETGLDMDLWLEKVKTAGSILFGRLNFNKCSYIDTYLSLTVYSRCLFEHGPTAKVSERQCEAALYLLNKEQFPRFQKQLLTVYKEVKPNVQTAGGSVVARPTVYPNVATQVQGRQLQNKVNVKYQRSAAVVVPTISVQNVTSIEDIFRKN